FNGGTILPSAPSPAVTDNTDLVRFRTRASIRDAVGLQGNGARVVDTGNLIADHVQSINGELLWYAGPLWVQSETCLAHVDNAFFPASAAVPSRRSELLRHLRAGRLPDHRRKPRLRQAVRQVRSRPAAG